ncbi:peptidase family M3 [Apiospora arundinis]
MWRSPRIAENIRSFASINKIDAIPFGTEPLTQLRLCAAAFAAGPTPIVHTESFHGRDLDDYNAAIEKLYTTLNTYCLCENTRIGLRMRLKIDQATDGTNPIFNIQFVIHPHSNMSSAAQDWQIVTMALASEALYDELQYEFAIARTAFCSEVCSEIQRDPVSILVSEGQLIYDDTGTIRPARLWLTRTTTTTLHTILKSRRKIEPKHRVRLMLLLARAVWQFYDTGWLRTPWSTADIHFITERRCEEVGKFIDEPFIMTQFEHGDNDPSESSKRRSKFNALKALGVMLLEIELGVLMEDEERNLEEYEFLQAYSRQYRAEWTANALYKRKERTGTIPDMLKDVIGQCLQPDKLRKYASESTALRLAIRDLLLKPVLATFEAVWSDVETTDLEKPTVPLSSSGPLPITPTSLTASVANESNGYSYLPSSEWFVDFGKLAHILDGNASCQRIKVAIIDTGINPDHQLSRAIKKYKDFTGGSKMMADNTGHGTDAVKLVYEMCSDTVEVYVARVWEREKDDCNSQHVMDLMKEAVHWAHHDCHADIISIASGFEEEHQELKQAIKDAVAKNVLVFAAAGNYGNMRKSPFPGRMSDQVFCIPSTPPGLKNCNRFAILGENIKLTPFDEPVSGTSYSTSIAAGLAARILHFSRQDHPRPIRKLENLPSFKGMSAVFECLVGNMDSAYQCLRPWMLVEDAGADETKEQKRDRICDIISLALEKSS